MIEAGDNDGVRGVEGAGDGAADVEGEGGHVGAEDNFLRAGSVEEIRHGSVGGVEDEVGLAAGGKDALVVGVAFEQILLDAVGGLAGDLGAAGVVEEDRGTVEGGELLTDEGCVEGHEGLLGADYNNP